tara:strand:- start:275 stop:520 length:246 start_codon:yes stop_codon:yes gene_type:complete
VVVPFPLYSEEAAETPVVGDNDGNEEDEDENSCATIVESMKLPSVSTESQIRIFRGISGDHGITSWIGTVFAFMFTIIINE